MDTEQRLSAIESKLHLIESRHARYSKIKSLEEKSKKLKDALHSLNSVIPYPFPDWFTPEIQKKVVDLLA